MKFDFSIHQVIETGIQPDRLAVSGSDTDLSWGEFHKLVQKFSDTFQQIKIPKGHPIIIYGHKQTSYVAALTAALINEIPYIPVDKIMPHDRIKKIKHISGSNVLVYCMETDLAFAFPITINSLAEQKINYPPDFSQSIHWRSNDPICYIIFTSGSTGEPKGVQITRNAVLSYLDWIDNDFAFSTDEVFMNQAPFSFDLSVYELYSFLHTGGTLILNTNEQTADPNIFLKRITEKKCSVWVSTPSFAYLYLRAENFDQKNISSIKSFLFCGETLPKKTVEGLRSQFPKSKVFNTYGPTEATVATTFIDVDDSVLKKYKDVPVGYPKYTSEVLIDNSADASDPAGEIIIAGENVSIGYFANTELNAQKFFAHNGKRAFRTGDYGYFKDGILFFLGRRDEQVKLHGYRIELGDINAQILNSCEEILEAVTVPLRKDGEVKRIVAFIKLRENKTDIANEKITERLMKLMPPYMIPSDFKRIDEFPFNSNHKIDKKRLIEIYSA